MSTDDPGPGDAPGGQRLPTRVGERPSDAGSSRTNSGDAGSARDHLANERTFLAWLRTGVAIVVLGFAIGRLALFLPEARGSSASIWLGTAAIAAGIALCFAGLLRYRHTRRGIEAGKVVPAGMLIEVVAFGAALFGLILAVYLVNPV